MWMAPLCRGRKLEDVLVSFMNDPSVVIKIRKQKRASLGASFACLLS